MGKPALVLAAVIAVLSHAQETKPAAKKPDSAPAAKPTELTVIGRSVTLTVPPEWKVKSAAGTFALDAWKHAKGWEHPGIRGFEIHVYGVEGKDLTPAALVKSWLDASGNAKVNSLVSVPGRNKSLKGLDTEVEVIENGATSYYWLRAIALAADKLLLVLVEACPVKADLLEEVVDAALPILDSILDPLKKDPWRRDPEFSLTKGGLVTRLKTPVGWTYGRSAEGWYSWLGPGEGQSVQLLFPFEAFPAENAKQPGLKIPWGELFAQMIVSFEESVKQEGKLLSKTPLSGHDQATEIVAASGPGEDEASTGEWTKSRFFLDGTHVVVLAATHPIPNVTAVPPDAFQKQMTTVFDSIKMEIVKK